MLQDLLKKGKVFALHLFCRKDEGFIFHSLKMKDKKNCRANLKGFTLIELLAVLAIISLITAIIITNLSKSRNISRDTVITSSLIDLRKAAELYYDKNKTYEGICNSYGTLSDEGDFGRIKDYINKYNGPNGVIGCKDSKDAYAVISSLNLKDCWCVDWQGNSEEVKLEGSADCQAKLQDTSCP